MLAMDGHLNKERNSVHQLVMGKIDGSSTRKSFAVIAEEQRNEGTIEPPTTTIGNAPSSRSSFTGTWPSSFRVKESAPTAVSPSDQWLGGQSWSKKLQPEKLAGDSGLPTTPLLSHPDETQGVTSLSKSWPASYAPSPTTSTVEMKLSLIGFGVESGSKRVENATEASVRAIKDALRQSVLSLPNQSSQCWQIFVKLGVPPQQNDASSSSSEPMKVDIARLRSVVPAALSLMPIEVVVGGLWIGGDQSSGGNVMCTVVASVTIQRIAAAAAPPPPRVTPLSQPPQLVAPTTIKEQTKFEPPRSIQYKTNKKPRQAFASMDLLAQISEEVSRSRIHTVSPPAVPHGFLSGFHLDPPSIVRSNTSPEKSATENHHTEVPVKINRRQYVQHNYTDHSLEKPHATDGALVLSGKNYNTAFPIKLYEVLSRLEQDGRDNIMSWQPHGRSFKIHKPQEFVELVLPQYFVMTKKSSFLRQLNLYGFQRLSAGPDKGTYYNELFLRGMRFLSRRMTRSKINGNRVRAAGNPEQEPKFYTMPSLPGTNSSSSKSTCAGEGTENGASDAHSISPIISSHDLQEGMRCQALSNHLSFPSKLQRMLDTLETEGDMDIISWLPHGRGFIVKDQDNFVKELMPKYFRQTKYSSFQRQLHMYTFQRITTGPDKGAYYHKDFLRNRTRQCQRMVRTRINGKGCRQPGNPSAEPDFYNLPPIVGKEPDDGVSDMSSPSTTEESDSDVSLENAEKGL